MQFSEVLSQDKLKRHLIDTFNAGRTAHAQIFIGPEGSGQLALALAYAQYLQCENPEADDSCGQCNACRKVQKNIHPDLHFSYPNSNDFPASAIPCFICDLRDSTCRGCGNPDECQQKLV